MRAIITGATSGIGYEFAYLLAKKGFDLLLIARKENILIEMKESIEIENKVSVEYMLCDFTHPDELESTIEKVKDLDIDVFINNAGFDISGEFTAVDYKDINDMISVNVITTTKLLYCILYRMKENKKGYVVNVASVAGILPMVYSSVYSATKSYLLQLSISLYQEYKAYGVYVSALCPGPTDSNFAKTAKIDIRKAFKNNVMSAKRVAAIGYKGMKKKKQVIVTGFINNTYVFMSRFLSRKLITAISAKKVK